jgi:hypothetical protein
MSKGDKSLVRLSLSVSVENIGSLVVLRSSNYKGLKDLEEQLHMYVHIRGLSKQAFG